MTVALVLKVGDGLVLGADSASTMSTGGGIANVYFNAEKVFNLVKGLPIGVVGAGLGGLSGRSVTSLSRDLRQRIKDAKAGEEWHLDSQAYTIEQGATLLRKFMWEEHYCREYPAGGTDRPSMSLLVAGYSAGQPHSEVWAIEIDQTGACSQPTRVLDQHQSGSAVWRGLPEAINRIINGWSPGIVQALMGVGIDEASAVALLQSAPNVPLIHSAMPLQDGIDLVQFLVETTVGFVRFAPGPPTVAPPIDLAAITKHEDFRWVRRKHYFTAAMNRPIDRHD